MEPKNLPEVEDPYVTRLESRITELEQERDGEREMLATLARETLGTLGTIAATAEANDWMVHRNVDKWDAAGIARRELERLAALSPTTQAPPPVVDF